MSVVYVYPKCPAGNSEGHWLSALHRFASVFSKPSILTLELTFFLLSLFFFPFFFLFCCLIFLFSRFFLCFSKTFATRFLAAMCDAASSALYLSIQRWQLVLLSWGLIGVAYCWRCILPSSYHAEFEASVIRMCFFYAFMSSALSRPGTANRAESRKNWAVCGPG